MNAVVILLFVSIFTALFGAYCAVRKVPGFTTSLRSRGRQDHPHLHFVDGDWQQGKNATASNEVYFDIQRFPASSQVACTDTGNLGISLEEFEKCIPWIPLDNKVFIRCPSGYTSQLLSRLKRLRTTRHLYLVRSGRSKQVTGMVQA